jgi:hypothetical protein
LRPHPQRVTQLDSRDAAATGADLLDVDHRDLDRQAGGVAAGLPAIDEVRAQIETQLKTSKEQEVVTAYIEELRAKATIEVLI